MTDEERRAHQEEMRRRSHARRIVDAITPDWGHLIDVDGLSDAYKDKLVLLELDARDAMVDAVSGELERIERIGYARGSSDTSAWWQDWLWPGAPDLRVVDEGLGLPRG